MKFSNWIAGIASLLVPSAALADPDRLAWAVRNGGGPEAANGNPLRGLFVFLGLIALFAVGCLWTRHAHRQETRGAVQQP